MNQQENPKTGGEDRPALCCPKCGRPMEPGFLQAQQIMAFNKKRYKFRIFHGEDPDSVILSQRVLSGADFSGYICKDCGLVVFDYKNPITHW